MGIRSTPRKERHGWTSGREAELRASLESGTKWCGSRKKDVGKLEAASRKPLLPPPPPPPPGSAPKPSAGVRGPVSESGLVLDWLPGPRMAPSRRCILVHSSPVSEPSLLALSELERVSRWM